MNEEGDRPLVTPVGDQETLHRRVHPTLIKGDGSVSSGAFNDDAMSVDRASMRIPEDSLRGYEGYSLVGFSAGFARSLDMKVEARPELCNPAHAEVLGKKTKHIRKKFARASRWVIGPVQSALHPVSQHPSEPPPS